MIALLLVLALVLPPAAPADAPTSVRVVFVEGSGESFSPLEQERALLETVRALEFWTDVAPAHPGFILRSTELYTTSANVFADLEWSRPFFVDDSPIVTIFLVDNSSSALLLGGDAAGVAQDYYRTVWSVLRGFPGADGLAATVAHELGHVLYHLPDRPRGRPDIMSAPPSVAFSVPSLGCWTRADLGAPCARTFVPIAQRLETRSDEPA